MWNRIMVALLIVGLCVAIPSSAQRRNWRGGTQPETIVYDSLNAVFGSNRNDSLVTDLKVTISDTLAVTFIRGGPNITSSATITIPTRNYDTDTDPNYGINRWFLDSLIADHITNYHP